MVSEKHWKCMKVRGDYVVSTSKTADQQPGKRHPNNRQESATTTAYYCMTLHLHPPLLNLPPPASKFCPPLQIWELLMHYPMGVGGLLCFGKLRFQGKGPQKRHAIL